MNALPFGYRPLGWKADLTAQDYLAHMNAEFDRLSIDPHKDLLQFTEVWRSLRRTGLDTTNNIQRYIDWAMKEVQAETGHVSTQGDFGFQAGFYLNQIGNFTMTWDPDEQTFERFGIRGNHSSPGGWSRPLNELVYIKELHYLRFPIDGKVLRGTTRIPTTSECLASDLLCCSRKAVEHVIEEVQREVAVSVVSEFNFTLEDKPLWTSPTPATNLVVDWEIEQL